jgi:hypothetical protein
MKIVWAVAVIALAAGLSSCASVVNGGSQTLEISTPPATGAACALVNSRGSWQVTTPGKVEVKRSKDNIAVTCRKDGWQDASGIIRPHMDQTALISSFLLTGGVGLSVDAASGAVNAYPEVFTVPMQPVVPPTPAESAPPVAPPVTPPAPAPEKPAAPAS